MLAECTYAADGVIHTAISHNSDMEKLDVHAVDAMLDGLEGTGKTFVYTSGTLIYNDTLHNVVDEDSAVNPLPFLQWKANQEQKVLTAAERNICTVVIRPALVYGRGGGLVGATIQRTKLAQFAKYVGDGLNAWSTIDVDDLANLYACAYTFASPGALYNAASKELITTKELMIAIGKIAASLKLNRVVMKKLFMFWALLLGERALTKEYLVYVLNSSCNGAPLPTRSSKNWRKVLTKLLQK